MKRFKEILSKIKDIVHNKKKYRLCIVSLSVSFVLLAISLSPFNSETRIERSAEYITDITKNKTINRDYSWLSVTDKNSGEGKRSTSLREAYDEYFYWKYIFRHSDFGYAKIANPSKNDLINFDEFNLGNNYSLICANRNHNYKIKNSEFYHHEFYDLEFMFAGKRIINQGDSNFFAISHTEAKSILESKGIVPEGEDFSKEQYFSLLGSSLKITINQSILSWTLDNIYFENTAFYNNLNKTIGKFFLSYISLSDSIKMADVYFFNTYTFQNMHKLKAVARYYRPESVNYEMCQNAFTEGTYFDNDILLSGLYPKQTSPVYYVIFSFEFLIGFLMIALLILFMPEENKLTELFIYLVPSLIPVLVFSVLSKALNNCYLFSFVSSTFIITFYVIYFILILLLFIKRGARLK